ncbi:MAG: hypothetical protein KGM24_04305, partial [Elusimicrobia bacterium]|nr:hypothetical protein [Elusimicrobiota bacterium]
MRAGLNPAALALPLLLAAVPALAQDAGRPVTFRALPGLRFSVQRGATAPRVVYDSGLSDPLPDAWDTVLIQGDLPDPAVSFQVSRPGAGAWTTLEVHRFPNGRFWAKARTSEAAGPLRLRALAAGAGPAPRVDVYGVTVFSSAAPPPAPAAP